MKSLVDMSSMTQKGKNEKGHKTFKVNWPEVFMLQMSEKNIFISNSQDMEFQLDELCGYLDSLEGFPPGACPRHSLNSMHTYSADISVSGITYDVMKNVICKRNMRN